MRGTDDDVKTICDRPSVGAVLPPITFICVGAQKAGTTSLYEILSQHPNVGLSLPKETHFFHDDAKYQKGLDAYHSHFLHASGKPILGEIDPIYMPSPKVPSRIAATLGMEVRILGCLRHPLDRAYSHYWMNRFKGYERLRFVDALEAETERCASGVTAQERWSYVYRGQYAAHYKRYREVFPAENIKTILYEQDFKLNPQQTMESVFKFIGAHVIRIPEITKTNVARRARLPVLNKFIRTHDSLVRRVARTLVVSPAVRAKIRHLNEKIESPPEIPAALRNSLIERFFLDDISELELLINRNLSDWKT